MVHPDCYYDSLGELFNPEQIEKSLETVAVTPKQEAILQFIVNNPDEQFISLLNTFDTNDTIVVRLAQDYGATSDTYDHYEALQNELRNHN